MTTRAAYGWAAAMLALGLGAALVATLRAGAGHAVPAALAVDAALGAAVFGVALALYGPSGALGALALVVLSPHAMAWNGAVRGSLAALLQVATVYVLMRNAFDPTIQWALVAGVAMAGAAGAAVAVGQPLATSALGLAAFSLLLVGVRTMTATPVESRRRVVHGALVSTALAWVVAGALWLVAASVVSVPSMEDFSHQHVALAHSAAFALDSSVPPGNLPARGLELAAVLLAAVRPWRRQRRYGDASWLLAVVCVALPLWCVAAVPNAAAVLTPPLAILGAACWDAWRPRWARRGATLIILAQLAGVVAQWPSPMAGQLQPVRAASAPRAERP